ncbi:uncharacterized protein si:ch211-156j16.1 isoform X1 [Xyrauchen texanus]|uniref:uncharacterized protein si:ch211-156j16.1 isoform X1 n=1 Tax=Xyrauchen texanus TaxID=154827 RepID=UPI002241A606|nr:uncharacterized protein si:ch211-156j16.1 isoform X1 [Xyrauchen texanus]
MMRIILLLLVALAGPFFTYTHASTLVVTTTPDVAVVTSEQSHAVTKKATEAAPQQAVSTAAVSNVEEATEAAATTANANEPIVSTEAPVIQTVASTEEAATTDAATVAVATEAANTETPTKVEKQEAVTDSVTESRDILLVEMEEEEQEVMGTGQLVGIVIGALIAVIFVIAVIILVVRRMGQYSTAKKRKPQKQEGIMISPLRRKPARQEEKKNKFWKI